MLKSPSGEADADMDTSSRETNQPWQISKRHEDLDADRFGQLFLKHAENANCPSAPASTRFASSSPALPDAFRAHRGGLASALLSKLWLRFTIGACVKFVGINTRVLTLWKKYICWSWWLRPGWSSALPVCPLKALKVLLWPGIPVQPRAWRVT